MRLTNGLRVRREKRQRLAFGNAVLLDLLQKLRLQPICHAVVAWGAYIDFSHQALGESSCNDHGNAIVKAQALYSGVPVVSIVNTVENCSGVFSQFHNNLPIFYSIRVNQGYFSSSNVMKFDIISRSLDFLNANIFA